LELRPKVLQQDGGLHEDHRGKLSYFNSFDLEGFHRFYIIEPDSKQTIRAWQAHKIESKAFVAVQGAFELAWVAIDDFENPSLNLQAQSIILSHKDPKLKIVPGGYANGFRALTENAKILVFSNRSLNASLEDDYRFDAELWHQWD
jgi:dTDP-4-dehydrorhamnose 3,5-epimerase